MAEKNIENALIEKLSELKYTYCPDIRDRATLEANFRKHFQDLNKVKLTDDEFKRLLAQITNPNVYEASRMLREVTSFIREDDTPLNFTLVNIKDWCKNTFEVVNQLKINTNNSNHRYDVILLINGLPVVQIELKKLDLNPKKAMEQIVGYKNDPGNGYTTTLLCFLQLFVISNQNDTQYFANNNVKHFSFNAEERFLPIYRHATEDNKKVSHLSDFAEMFLSKCVLGQMISQYMVLVASEQKLMIMRPYQIYAVKAIVECIKQNSGNGFIWHTTGSGKTLTSFKASTLLKENPNVDKCLFVVDRKDLDRQTREEFNRFQQGCVEENTNTETLVRRMLSADKSDKVIVTTIQKLGLALSDPQKRYRDRLHDLRKKRFVFIFDECHRSQFGENHKAIREFFPEAQLFGFTGTPIFAENASKQQRTDDEATNVTTLDVFQKQLHAYTITNAIDDGNVLRFKVEYFRPEGSTETANEAKRKEAIMQSIIDKHNKVTDDRKFNAILATASINDAIAYYQGFAELQKSKAAEDAEYTPLNITCVFSPPPGVSSAADQLREDLPQETDDYKLDPAGKKEALTTIINDYNARFRENFNIGDFDGYYKDVQKRIKDHQYSKSDLAHGEKLDLVIVVDMLLTGFDSKYLNTLYVDKPLKQHGLIQAFSRTNRVLNNTKPFGNILTFRDQEEAVNEAITLFSGEKTDNPKEIWLVDKSPVVVEKLKTAVEKLHTFLKAEGVEPTPSGVNNLQGDEARGQFISLFKEVQRLSTQIDQYTDLTPEQKEVIETVLPKELHQGFKGAYMATAEKLRTKKTSTNPDNPDQPNPAQELDFEFVLFSSAVIDYDYIMALMATYSGQSPERQEMTREQIERLINADSKFMGVKGDDLKAYLRSLPTGKPLTEEAIRDGLQAFIDAKNARWVNEVADKHGIAQADLAGFVREIMERMIFDARSLTDLLAPLSLGWKARAEKELALMEDLVPVLKYLAGEYRRISGLETYE